MWDLEGLCDKELLDNFEYYLFGNKIRFLFYYLIGCLYYNSEKYHRTNSLGLQSHEFTTSEEIFNTTGIYSISFTEYFPSQIINSFTYLIDYSDNLVNNVNELFSDRHLSEDFFESFSVPYFDINNIEQICIKGSSDVLIYFHPIFDIASFYGIMKFISFEIICLGYNKYLCWDDLLADNVLVYDYKSLVTKDFIHRISYSNLGPLFLFLDNSLKEFPVIFIDSLKGFYYQGREKGFNLLFSHLDMKFEKVYIKYDRCHQDELRLFMRELKDYLRTNENFDIKVKVEKRRKDSLEPDIYACLILGSFLEE